MKTPENDLTSLDDFVDAKIGGLDTPARKQFEQEYQAFKLGAMIAEARMHRGISQRELAIRVGMSKSYISRLENDVKEVRISTLQRIIELGFGGKLKISIDLDE